MTATAFQQPLVADRPLAAVLFDRLGWTKEFLAAIDDGAHPELRDLDRLLTILNLVREQRTKIVVMPDFDTDGVTSGITAYAGLSQLGFDVELYIPDYANGHDVTPKAVAQLLDKHPDARVVLTTDAGTNSHEGIAFGHDAGLIMLVTDHHQQLPSETPLKAAAIVNPYRLDETYPHPDICGAHVIFQVLQAFASRFAPAQADKIDRLALFAGLGTVADVMPLRCENRALVRRSLSLARLAYHPANYMASALAETIAHERRRGQVSQIYADAFDGFGQLLQIMTERDVIRDAYLREDIYSFYVTPAVNSARRILSDGGNAFRCFLGSHAATRAKAINAILDDNIRRRELSARYLVELDENPQPYAPYVWISDAPAGMVGLLASNLSLRYDSPIAVVYRNEKYPERGAFAGSARAPVDVDIITAFDPVEGISAIGHAQACGVWAASEDHLIVMADELRALHAAREQAAPDTDEPFPGLVLGDTHDADAHRPNPSELLDVVNRIAAVGPFGHGFPEPTHKVVVDPAQMLVTPLGRPTYDDQGNELTPAGKHTRIVSLNSGLQLLWWNSADDREALPDGSDAGPARPHLEFLVRLASNTFKGNTKLQCVVEARLA